MVFYIHARSPVAPSSPDCDGTDLARKMAMSSNNKRSRETTTDSVRVYDLFLKFSRDFFTTVIFIYSFRNGCSRLSS